MKYDQISISEIKEGGSTLILGYDQTLIKLEGTIKIDESLNGRVQFQKIDAKYKNSASTDKSEVTALDFFITGSF